MAHYNIEEVPEYFQPIIEQIEELFDAWVIIDDYDDEWLQFHIPSLVDRYVITKIEKNIKTVLVGDEQKTFQILCAWSPADGEGLLLHYLEDPIARGEYRAGAWFY
jgi:hypothetical protein